MGEMEIPGLPLLIVSDLPSFPATFQCLRLLLRLVMDQFDPLKEATWILEKFGFFRNSN